jgi:cytochrome c oxidase assembly protein subunit 15
MTENDNKAIAIWLLVCCAMIFAMVVLGGVTRLTGSGLSMVRWEPVTGIFPPMSEAEWQQEFAHYQASPEYQKINVGMDLTGFKRIYWFEFAHRLLGRAIGVVFLLPFLYFLLRRKIERPLIPRLGFMFVLGGLQGLLGWYMVKSGLVDDPHVSQYRLTAHLAAAIVIYAYMFWVALDLLTVRQRSGPGGRHTLLGPYALVTAGLIFLTILSGGFVAGTKAGFAYNTFPLMDGRWIPEGLFALSPLYRNLFENIATVQFDHRLLAILTLIAVTVFWWAATRVPMARRARLAAHLLFAMVLIQVTLGISTLLLHVPVSLAAAHQAGALALFTLGLFASHELARRETAAVQPAA